MNRPSCVTSLYVLLSTLFITGCGGGSDNMTSLTSSAPSSPSTTTPGMPTTNTPPDSGTGTPIGSTAVGSSTPSLGTSTSTPSSGGTTPTPTPTTSTGNTSGTVTNTATVVDKIPANNATGISVSSPASISFTKALDTTTMNDNTAYLTTAGGTRIASMISYDSSNNTITLTPTLPLSNGLTYTATITSGVKDTDGYALPATTSWSFTTISTGTNTVYEAEDSFFTGGVNKSGGTYLQNFAAVGAKVVFTVNVPTAGNYAVNLSYNNPTTVDQTLNIYVNGIFSATGTFQQSSTPWSTNTVTLALRAGINTISYQYDTGNTGTVAIDALSITNGLSIASQGATLPYLEYEAELGSSNASISNYDTTYLSAAAESSGRKHVTLSSTGHYVQWITPKAVNSLIVRYSIPDSTDGTGSSKTLGLYINGIRIKTLNLNSTYAWIYGNYPFNNTPANGKAHRFFDESRFSNLSIPAGATIRLQKDAIDTAAYYQIDLIDLETVEAVLTKPSSDVSIVDFGAVANDGFDDTTAINSAIAYAKANNKGVWIPEGIFTLTDRINVSNIQIHGAGMWYSQLQGTNGKGGFLGTGNNVTITDLSILGDSTILNDSTDHAGFEGNFGTGSLIQNVWVEHMKAGFLLSSGTDGLYVLNGRIRNTWSDGINLSGNVKNTLISQFNVRNSGDDAMSMWSNGTANIGNTFRYNTAQLPMRGHAFAIYGGQDNKLLDNIGSDTVTAGAGIAFNTDLTISNFAGTTEAKRNALYRTGSYDQDNNISIGSLSVNAQDNSITAPITIDTLSINNSLYDGIKFSFNQVISNITINNVKINGATQYGLRFDTVLGSGNFSNISVTNATLGGLSNPLNLYTINRGSGNSGW